MAIVVEDMVEVVVLTMLLDLLANCVENMVMVLMTAASTSLINPLLKDLSLPNLHQTLMHLHSISFLLTLAPLIHNSKNFFITPTLLLTWLHDQHILIHFFIKFHCVFRFVSGLIISFYHVFMFLV